mmetsp:Transcript_66039/g.155986  ORF Transcript_66039/g.155986 Transcript_66039/m.155986 type:complete len:225 (+) Transcript_66039:191-865(+)
MLLLLLVRRQSGDRRQRLRRRGLEARAATAATTAARSDHGLVGGGGRPHDLEDDGVVRVNALDHRHSLPTAVPGDVDAVHRCDDVPSAQPRLLSGTSGRDLLHWQPAQWGEGAVAQHLLEVCRVGALLRVAQAVLERHEAEATHLTADGDGEFAGRAVRRGWGPHVVVRKRVHLLSVLKGAGLAWVVVVRLRHRGSAGRVNLGVDGAHIRVANNHEVDILSWRE